MRNIGIIIISIALVLLCAACGRPWPQGMLEQYRAQNFEPGTTRRVAMLPIEPGTAPPPSVQLIRDALVAMLSARYDVVQLPATPAGLVDPAGAMLIDGLLAARDKAGADAVLQTKIVDYRACEPPSITMTVRLISTDSGQVVWMASGTIDSARPDVERRIKEYFSHTQNADESLFGWRTMLLSERRYAQFVANEFLLSVNQPRRP